MIESIIRWSIGNRFFVLLITLIIAFGGLYSLQKTPVDALPDLSDVQVIIKTSYPGQAPQVVQDQVTFPLTTAMLSVPGAQTVRGYSFFGDSYVYIIFDDDTDLYWARSRVLEYLSQVASSLPDSAKPQLGPDATGVGWVYIYALTDKSGNHDLSQLRSIQDWFLKYELQTVPGVSEVSAVGGMVKQYQVQVDPDKLRAYDIPLSLIQIALQKGNKETGASVVEMAEAEYMVTATGYIQSVSDIEKIPLGINEQGTPLRIGDVANVNLGPQMRRGIAELNGEGEVVGGVVVMRFGENAQQTINGVKEKLESLKSSLPEGVEVVPVYDRSKLIDRAVDNLWSKLLEELAVVAIVCVAFLFHLRSSIVAVITLPLGILVSFIIMYMQGINANIMSLGGIAIAIGAMTDGAIVMIENMHKHMEKTPLTDENRWQIVAKAASEVGPALFFSLLIITVSFLPVFILEAQEGRMFSPLAYTKTYAMAASAGLAITLVPVLMGYFIRGKVVSEKKNPLNRLLIAIYMPVLKQVMKFPKSTIVAAILVTIVGFWPVDKIGSEFIPPLDEGDLMYMPTTYPGISIGKARELLQQTDKLIRTVPEVETVFGKVGRAETATDPAPLTMIETFIQLKPQEQWREGVTTESLKAEFDKLVKFPGLTNAWVMPIKTRIDMLATGIKTPVGIKVAGPELDVIQEIGQQIEQILPEVTGTASVYSERVAGGRYIKVDISRDKASRFGLNIEDVQQVVSTAIGGMNVTQTVEGQERYPVNLRYPQDYRDSPEQLSRLPVVTPSGQRIALGDVADIRVENGPPGIKSENARLNGWTFIDIDGVDVGTYVESAKIHLANNLKLPAGYSITWAGQYEYMERAKEKLTYVLPLTLAIIVILLYLNFRAFSEVAIIIVTLPMAMIGGLWLMYLEGFNFSVAVGVGFIALAGVAVEIGVIMLVYLNQALAELKEKAEERAEPISDDAYQDALLHGAGLRVRPVMMTVATIIIGLMPILYGTGTGSEIMSRIAAPMVGGMTSAVLLTLIVLPVIYSIVKKPELNAFNKELSKAELKSNA
ncbi:MULTISPECIES: efflux RND transporter permease subunit [Pseudoalteromonas]|jgi:Cu(I)/Ag(I) efflux system membrane protein CusA/SilA|uniref:Cu(I)/Ag(I) efflux system membrane protein CusA/SilA n=6 Tax=Alteromonadales TaxID=135622 RepID=A0AAC9UH20_9GAMM|nr:MULTISPECIES: efflux RND transporter permease subunit [Pseudoalteromonas]MBL1385651.1 efflux RND transporter permease subunit [Colwellia sp.]ASM53504.1 Cu(I)/Ag(I) efflux system membrane protein CusA/SilA [Pseudoalteromonas nigrifaciens]MBB1505368.1 efflux RND transporter permease subunit [Pseudoalteromonas sp. SG41-1]MCK8137819.1 efflux RND transporter permease subunit [Pseudoalteromonas sp. 2CM28B]MDN3401690.1 efflux RND transporter permease subunit [Pseudoalteromonas sp. APC 3213]|tara:strand:+ start:1939 stop:5103 length:3165 start_codon:yes stop_codon:yes gene_type:complete